jgi:hypothetical protein
MEIARFVLDLLKVILSAQVVTGAVIVFFLAFFRIPVAQLIGRIKSVKGPAGTGAEFSEQLRTVEEVKPQLAKTHEVALGEQLTLTDAAAQGGPAPAANAAAAATQQAEATLQGLQTLGRWWIFEKVYRSIFRSQIELLRYLERKPDHRAGWSELQTFYQLGILAHGTAPETYPYQNYMNYLVNVGLIHWTTPPGAPEPQVTLTPLGVEFLQYLVLNNYNIFERPN